MARLAEVASDHNGQPDPGDTHTIRAFDTDQQLSARTGWPAHMPEDLLVCIAGFLDWHDLWLTTRVCRFWRYAILNCAPIWAHLDLYDYGHHALHVLPQLLPLSGQAPFELRVWFPNEAEHSNNIGTLCSQLEPHLHRLRALTVRSRRRSTYHPVFNLLQHDAPLLQYLDVAHDHRESLAFEFPPDVPSACLALAPNLSFVNWGSHRLPEAHKRLIDLTNFRIDRHLIPMDQIFSLLPCAQTLHLDSFTDSRDVQPLPLDHPLVSLTLSVDYQEQIPYPFSWELVQSLGLARVPLLRLCHYATTVVIYACEDPDWKLTSVKIDYDDFVDASFTRRDSHSQCRMSDLAPYRSTKWSMARLMGETDWLRALASLTLSMELSVEQKRPSLLLPRGRLPALREFSLLCGTEGLKGRSNGGALCSTRASWRRAGCSRRRNWASCAYSRAARAPPVTTGSSRLPPSRVSSLATCRLTAGAFPFSRSVYFCDSMMTRLAWKRCALRWTLSSTGYNRHVRTSLSEPAPSLRVAYTFLVSASV